jgi:hypothetical protein
MTAVVFYQPAHRWYTVTGGLERAICWRTKSPFCHVAIASDGMIFESVAPRGLRLRPMASCDFSSVSMTLPYDRGSTGRLFARVLEGARYGWIDLMRLAIGWKAGNGAGLTCSEFVADVINETAYREGHDPMFDAPNETPASIYARLSEWEAHHG